MDFFPATGEPESTEASKLLWRYFSERKHDGSPRFTGARFERLAGGGDRPETAYRVTADDLVAVSMLGVHVPGEAARAMLEDNALAIHALLSAIPPDLDLWDAEDDHIDSASPAWELWRQVRQHDDVGPTITSKLLARKRPRLVPVFDDVIEKASGLDIDDAWTGFREVLTRERVQGLIAHRTAAGLGPEISILRLLDVLIWMEHWERRNGR